VAIRGAAPAEQRAVVAKAAAHALEVIEPVYGMSRPAADDDSAPRAWEPA
jgi:hypothetical protein